MYDPIMVAPMRDELLTAGFESLSTTEQVDDDHFGIRRVIGDDQCFCWSGKQIDANAAIELAFGFGKVLAFAGGLPDVVERPHRVPGSLHAANQRHSLGRPLSCTRAGKPAAVSSSAVLSAIARRSS